MYEACLLPPKPLEERLRLGGKGDRQLACAELARKGSGLSGPEW